MKRALALAALAAAFCGCGAFSQRPEDSIRVEAYGEGKDETSSTDAARRAAVTSLFDLFLSTTTQAEKADVLEKKILVRAKDFLGREHELSRERGPATVKRKLEAWVSVTSLARALESAKLVRPEGVRGRPVIVIALRQKEAARKIADALNEHGYLAEMSDSPSKGDITLSGGVTVSAVDDPRLTGMFGARARLDGVLRGLGDPQPVEADAQAFDVTREGASERALENAGVIAAESARRRLAQRYVERAELAIIVENMGSAGQTLGFVRRLRSEPGMAGASLEAIMGKDVKVRVFAERMSADDLAAKLMHFSPYALLIKAVDTDLGLVEVVEQGEAPGA